METNYIKRLQATVQDQHLALEAMKAELRDLRRYLTSSKFWDDTTVQVADVLRRLEAVEQAQHASC